MTYHFFSNQTLTIVKYIVILNKSWHSMTQTFTSKSLSLINRLLLVQQTKMTKHFSISYINAWNNIIFCQFCFSKKSHEKIFFYAWCLKKLELDLIFSPTSVYNNHLRSIMVKFLLKMMIQFFFFGKKKINFSRQKASWKNNYPPLIKQFSSDKR